MSIIAEKGAKNILLNDKNRRGMKLVAAGQKYHKFYQQHQIGNGFQQSGIIVGQEETDVVKKDIRIQMNKLESVENALKTKVLLCAIHVLQRVCYDILSVSTTDLQPSCLIFYQQLNDQLGRINHDLMTKLENTQQVKRLKNRIAQGSILNRTNVRNSLFHQKTSPTSTNIKKEPSVLLLETNDDDFCLNNLYTLLPNDLDELIDHLQALYSHHLNYQRRQVGGDEHDHDCDFCFIGITNSLKSLKLPQSLSRKLNYIQSQKLKYISIYMEQQQQDNNKNVKIYRSPSSQQPLQQQVMMAAKNCTNSPHFFGNRKKIPQYRGVNQTIRLLVPNVKSSRQHRVLIKDKQQNEKKSSVKLGGTQRTVNKRNGIRKSPTFRRSNARRMAMYRAKIGRIDQKMVRLIEKHNPDDFCTKCNQKKVVDYTIDHFICRSCMEITPFMENDTKNLSFKDNYHFVKITVYEKLNHFKKWLSHSQAKERTTIPEKVLKELIVYFFQNPNKNRENHDDINPETIRQCLKRHKRAKYYANIPTIECLLTGRPPMLLNNNEESILISMFNQIQGPFNRLKGERSNILYYGYLLRKFCEINGWYHYAKRFSRLKSEDCLRNHDMIWKKICVELKWKYRESSLINRY